jgi:hypothetical protein
MLSIAWMMLLLGACALAGDWHSFNPETGPNVMQTGAKQAVA